MDQLNHVKAIAASMKQKYRAFEQLEQAITAVEQSAQLLGEKQAQHAALDREIAEKQAVKSELVNQTNNLADRKRDMEAGYKKKSDEMAADLASKKSAIAAEFKAFERECELKRAALKEEVATLENDRKAAASAVESLKKTMQEIRAKINI